MFYMICICYIHTNGNIISILSYILIHSRERRNIYRNKKDQLLKLINKQLTHIVYIKKTMDVNMNLSVISINNQSTNLIKLIESS